jgi:hypothetical protein
VGNKQPAKKAKAKRQVMAESVTFEPQNNSELKRFFEENKDKHHEIWIIIKKQKRRKSSASVIQPSHKRSNKTGAN